MYPTTYCEKKPTYCVPEFDPANAPPMNDPMYPRGCGDCEEEMCKDIQTGTFEFTGPAILLGVCNIHKSYRIFRKVSGDCLVPTLAIFPGAATSQFPSNPSVEYSLAGDYVVEYNWDACCEEEPQFEDVSYPCPCPPAAPAPAPAPADPE